jgi:hypothetical protein
LHQRFSKVAVKQVRNGPPDPAYNENRIDTASAGEVEMKAWWRAWGEVVLKLVALAGSVASLVGLLRQFLPSPKDLPHWAVALLVVAPLLFIVFIVLEFHDHRPCRVYASTDIAGIKKYMHDWIKHGSRVAIWTRDMSWAHDDDTRSLLKEKAAGGELILCLPEQNDLAKELAAAGAEVCVYGTKLLESPASRFTIVFYGRDGARVAVGRADGNTHVIDEFNSRSHPAFYLAADLVALVRAKCADRNAV